MKSTLPLKLLFLVRDVYEFQQHSGSIFLSRTKRQLPNRQNAIIVPKNKTEAFHVSIQLCYMRNNINILLRVYLFLHHSGIFFVFLLPSFIAPPARLLRFSNAATAFPQFSFQSIQYVLPFQHFP